MPAPVLEKQVPERKSKFQVLPSFVNVRASPSVKASILARRFQGDVFESDMERDGWVRDASARYGDGVAGWLLVDGAALGLGSLLRRVDDAVPVGDGAMSQKANSLERYLPLISRAPEPVPSEGPLPAGVCTPVRRWRVQRPMTLVHAEPSRESPVIDVALHTELVWSAQLGDDPNALRWSHAPDASDWVRLAVPNGWVHKLCPGGFPQLAPPAETEDWHRDRPARELEALDLFCQAKVAVFQTYGVAGRLKLPKMFDGWEAEALEIANAAEERPEAWVSVQKERALLSASAFAQTLLSVCHRDVVLEAQSQARSNAALPADCRRTPLAGERPLTAADVDKLSRDDLVVIDDLLPPDVISACCREAEALDAAGHLAPPAMHRALGDRRDRLVGLNEDTDLLPRDSALGQLVAYLKSLAFDLDTLGYPEKLTVPASVMLACYDGQGAFCTRAPAREGPPKHTHTRARSGTRALRLEARRMRRSLRLVSPPSPPAAVDKPHMDSASSDPRRLTAIVYLVPPDWDARPEADGGQLNWWIVTDESAKENEAAKGDVPPAKGGAQERINPPAKRTLDPRAGRLVLFKARTVMHEVLPTHRKRFALTLWYFNG